MTRKKVKQTRKYTVNYVSREKATIQPNLSIKHGCRKIEVVCLDCTIFLFIDENLSCDVAF